MERLVCRECKKAIQYIADGTPDVCVSCQLNVMEHAHGKTPIGFRHCSHCGFLAEYACPDRRLFGCFKHGKTCMPAKPIEQRVGANVPRCFLGEECVCRST